MNEPFCLHLIMFVFQVMSLDYAIVVYLLFLICFAYVLIKRHDKLDVNCLEACSMVATIL